jgi:hypothetical protein
MQKSNAIRASQANATAKAQVDKARAFGQASLFPGIITVCGNGLFTVQLNEASAELLVKFVKVK